MDRTAIIVVTICVILLFTWPALLEKISPTPPQSIQPTNAPPAQIAVQTNTLTAPTLAQPQPAPVSNTTTTRPPVVPESESVEIIETSSAVYNF